MSSRRTAKVAEAIREVVSTTILFELRDPRIRHVTVLGVEVPEDLRSAKVSVSVMGTDAEQKLCLQGLQSSRGFLQRRIADRLDLRYTPVLSFVLDQGVKKSIEASRILRELAAEREAAGPAPADSEASPEGEDAPTRDALEEDEPETS
jgi:ribosome-binding factor A